MVVGARISRVCKSRGDASFALRFKPASPTSDWLTELRGNLYLMSEDIAGPQGAIRQADVGDTGSDAH